MNFDELNTTGVKYAKRGEMQKARNFFQKAMELEPENPGIWNNIGNTYYHREAWKKAIPYYEKALEINPKYSEPYLSLGVCLCHIGLRKEAIALYEKGLEELPDNVNIWYNLGYALMEMGKVPEAVAAFDHVLAMSPKDSGAIYNRSSLLSKCAFKGVCKFFQTEGPYLSPQNGLVYSWNGSLFLTLAVDIIEPSEQEHYDPLRSSIVKKDSEKDDDAAVAS